VRAPYLQLNSPKSPKTPQKTLDKPILFFYIYSQMPYLTCNYGIHFFLLVR